jgi:hypothetical protein
MHTGSQDEAMRGVCAWRVWKQSAVRAVRLRGVDVGMGGLEGEWVDGRGLEVRCCVPRLRVYCVCRLHRQQDAGLAYYLGTQTPLGAGKEVRYRHAYQRYFCISVWSLSRDTSTLTSQHVDVCSPLLSAPSACANTTRLFASHHIPLTDILHVSSLGRMPVSSPPLPFPASIRAETRKAPRGNHVSRAART